MTGRKSGFGMTLAKLLIGTALAFPASQAVAGHYHRNGDKIVYSGQVDIGDADKLERILAAAKEQGIEIKTIVFRSNPGGVAFDGTSMGDIIRENGLDTVYQGGCYSACTAGFVGGVNRSVANNDLPLFHPNFESNIFGIHGMSGPDGPVEDQTPIVEHYKRLLQDEISPEAMARIEYAMTHMKDSQGFLRYFPHDPTKQTTYCPTADTTASDCIAYPGVTIQSDGVVNTEGTVDLSDDYLWVKNKTVTGNINPGFQNIMYPSRNTSTGYEDPNADQVTPVSLENAYGVIRVANGGVWHMNARTGADIITAEKDGVIYVEKGTDSPIHYVRQTAIFMRFLSVPVYTAVNAPTAVWVGAIDGGSILLRNGLLTSDLVTTVRTGGTLGGYGAIGSSTSVAGGATFAPNGIAIQPYQFGYEVATATPSRLSTGDVSVNLSAGSNTRFDISAKDTGAKIQMVEASVLTKKLAQWLFIIDTIFDEEKHRGVLTIGKGATATANFARDYYTAGWKSILAAPKIVEGTAYGDPASGDFRVNDPNMAFIWANFGPKPEDSDTPFITGTFSKLKRDAADAGIDFKDGAIFHPRANSLLTFTLSVKPDTFYLTANPAFEDVGVFGNKRSGNGLGQALRTASHQTNPKLAPLLGALQFADRDIAKRESGTLRGDGHASLRLANASFANLFDSTLRAQVAGMRRLNGANFIVAQPKPKVSTEEGAEAETPVETNSVVQPGPFDDSNTSFWIAGFGQTARLGAQGGVDRMDFDAIGTLFGISRQIGDATSIGGAFGYGSLDARERFGSGLRAKGTSYGGSIYADHSYGPGYVYGQVGYRWMKNKTDRAVIGIEGLEANNRANYKSKALTAALEHGVTVTGASPTRLTLIVPTVEYSRLSGVDFVERGGPAALVGSDDKFESFKVGGGLELTQNVTTAGGQRFAPYVRGLYKHEFGDREAVLLNGFGLDPSLSFASASRLMKRGLIEWGAGISSPASQNVTVSVGYTGQKSGGFNNHGVRMAVGVRF